jgi:pimeloyl-ACP methyl ester carboxylesterase
MRHRVVVLNPRGFGESDSSAGGYDLNTAARDLHGFLEATNLATPEEVIGCHPHTIIGERAWRK